MGFVVFIIDITFPLATFLMFEKLCSIVLPSIAFLLSNDSNSLDRFGWFKTAASNK